MNRSLPSRRPARAARLASMALACLGLAAILPTPAAAQCTPTWLPGDGTPGTNGTVYATINWDPDGPGSQTPKLVIGGTFTLAGDARATSIALYDPATGHWSALGTGVNNIVRALAVLPNGNLVAGGYFTTAGGAPANYIAQWNGTSWSAMPGLNGSYSGPDAEIPCVAALTIAPDGTLIAGGTFNGVDNIARWNGSTWSRMSYLDGLPTNNEPTVTALTTLPNGDIVAGGKFIMPAPPYDLGGVARWNGSSWVPLGTGFSAGFAAEVYIYDFAVLPNGDLVAGGRFTDVSGAPAANLARWNGSSWSAFGSGMNGVVRALDLLPSGELIASGNFTTANGVPANRIASWNGSAWSPLGSGTDQTVYASVIAPDGSLFIGGLFASAGNSPARSLARWSGSQWSAIGSGFNADVNTLITLPDGDFIAGGSFTSAGHTPVNYIARSNGATWQSLGSGLSGSVFPRALTAVRMSNGDLIVGGSFTAAGGVPASNIARWDGSAWFPLGTGLTGTVVALAVLANGDVVAAGYFAIAGGTPAYTVARWDGAAWLPIGPSFNSSVNALAVLPNGTLIAGGDFTLSGSASVNHIASWNGSAWTQLASGLNSRVRALAALSDGSLVAGGDFTSAGSTSVKYVARWNGAAWSALGTGITTVTSAQVSALTVLSNGDLIAVGYLNPNSWTSPLVARWNGSTWSYLGSGSGVPTHQSVNAVAELPNGDLVIGGSFVAAGGYPSAYFARYSLTGIPTIAVPPAPQSLTVGHTLVLSATPANGYSGVSVQWLRDGTPIANGPGGASPAGGTVTGASSILASPTKLSTATLTITNAQPSDAGLYSAVFSNTCGSASTSPALISITAACPADFTSDGFVDDNDFVLFTQAYDAFTVPPANPACDLNGDSFVDDTDFVLFANAYDAFVCP